MIVYDQRSWSSYMIVMMILNMYPCCVCVCVRMWGCSSSCLWSPERVLCSYTWSSWTFVCVRATVFVANPDKKYKKIKQWVVCNIFPLGGSSRVQNTPAECGDIFHDSRNVCLFKMCPADLCLPICFILSKNRVNKKLTFFYVWVKVLLPKWP